MDAARVAGVEPVELLVAGENVEPALLADVSTLGHPPRVIGVFRREELPRGTLPEVGLALWRVGDPGNVGTLIRSADALGPAFVALSEGSADPTGPKALRASMGSLFRIPVVSFDEAPGRRVALTARGGRPLGEIDLEGATTLVLGAEREGLPEEVVAQCDERVTIPLAAGASRSTSRWPGRSRSTSWLAGGRRARGSARSPPAGAGSARRDGLARPLAPQEFSCVSSSSSIRKSWISKTVARMSKSVSRIRVVASGSSTQESSDQISRPSRRLFGTACDPGGVLAACERAAVEPAVARLGERRERRRCSTDFVLAA